MAVLIDPGTGCQLVEVLVVTGRGEIDWVRVSVGGRPGGFAQRGWAGDLDAATVEVHELFQIREWGVPLPLRPMVPGSAR